MLNAVFDSIFRILLEIVTAVYIVLIAENGLAETNNYVNYIFEGQ